MKRAIDEPIKRGYSSTKKNNHEKITKKAIKIVSSLSSNSGGTNAKSDRQHSNTSIQDRRIFRGMCRKRIESGLRKFRDYFGGR